MKMATRFRTGDSRRGVTLLMVISIVVLFLLMGTAFMVLATQFRRSATMLSHVRERRDDARSLVSRAFRDLLREPSLDNSASPLRGHSLLGDIYGYGYSNFAPVPATTLNNLGNGVWEITLQTPTNHQLKSDLDPTLTPVPTPLTGIQAYAGRQFSITGLYATGQPANLFSPLTGTVVSYEFQPGVNPAPDSYVFQVSFGNEDARILTASTYDSFDFHINGRPFNGSGAGQYTGSTGGITNFLQPALNTEALRPNRSVLGETRSQLWRNYLSIFQPLPNPPLPNDRSTNEDYDAVDYQNMFLGWVRPSPSGPNITPSFYRPELVKYWAQPGSLGQKAYSFHADRTDGNGNPIYVDADGNGIPDINEAGGQVVWDVDNDGDGVNDSIWMDIGLPLQTDVKGKVYRPLVAYHVLDMDGRLNLNFHGNGFERDPSNTSRVADATRRRVALFGLYGDINNLVHPTGMGIGTGDIALGYALSQATLEKIFYGFDGVTGRYGSDGQLPLPNTLGVNNGPGAFGVTDASFGLAPYLPKGAFANNFGLVNAANYHSPLDIHGRFELGVPTPDASQTVQRDPYDATLGTISIASGMPVINATGSSVTDELSDSVYEFSALRAPFSPRLGLAPNQVVTNEGMDTPYAADELEAVLRVFDFDSKQLGLSGLTSQSRLTRLQEFLDLNSNPDLRHLLTTESWDLAVPPQQLWGLFQDRWGRAPTVDDLPLELAFGRKWELGFVAFNPTLLDKLPRHLFTIALLVCPEPTDFDYNADGTTDVQDQLAYRRDLAQWCVNVRDFIDADSINTGLLFDLQPEDGWTPTIAIWGCERPELLLTESFGLHDKRLEDLDSEASGTTTTDTTNADDDLDSRYVPNASAFIELYNPWLRVPDSVNRDTNRNSDVPPVELYDALQTGVDLQKVAPNDASFGSAPVWRVRILKSETNTNGNIDEANITDAGSEVVKIVYFTRPNNTFLNAMHNANPDVVFFPPAAVSSTPTLQPGKRAIIGSAGVAQNNLYTTYIGRLNASAGVWNDPAALARTRRIILDPTNNRVRTFYWDVASGSMRSHDANQVVCIPIGEQFVASGGGGAKPRNFGLTDPKRGYEAEVADLNPNYILRQVEDGWEFFDNTTMLPVTLDVPADKQFQPQPWNAIPTLPTLPGGGLRDEGKIMSCFTVHLQRLANPLLPYNPTTNPYLTVDYIGSDVSIINGIYSGNDPDRQQSLDDNLASFERGNFHKRLGGQRERLLWKGTQDGSLTVDMSIVRNAAGADQHIVSRDVIQSLGEIDLAYRGDGSSEAFPWLTWNNRPLVSPLELQNVPYTPQSQLTSRFDLIGPTPDNPYLGFSSRAGTGPNSPFPHAADRFNHLFNFYADSVTSGPSGSASGPPALHRMFDYLWTEVRSRSANSPTRHPGRINLNTIADERVWKGLMQKYGEVASPQNPYGRIPFQVFEQNRAGTGANLPTAIANPFRNAEAVNRVPLPQLLTRTSSATLFRSLEYTQANAPPGNTPLFDLSQNNVGPWANPKRNAYFSYDIRQRLGNLTTTRSNVYAVWVTVGFFEVGGDGKPTYEIGAEQGTAQRFRGFFLVDRTIPVAFEPGKDHDVENCVLIESIIQREVNSQK